MGDQIRIDVRGYVPAPQGSKRHVGNGVMVESCKTVKQWRAAVADAAVQQGATPLAGTVEMDAVFVFPRPRSHYGTGKNADKLKASAPELHSVRPDVSKLLRSTEDALSSLAYQDDARIARTTACKRYAAQGELPGALIVVRAIDPNAAAG